MKNPSIPKRRIPTHPGEVLLQEFLVPLGIRQVDLSAHIDVSARRINEVVRGRRGITPAMAWLLAGALGTTPEFWISLQSQHGLAKARPTRTIRRMGRSA